MGFYGNCVVLVAPSVDNCPGKAIGPFISTSEMPAEISIDLYPSHTILTKSLVEDLLKRLIIVIILSPM